MTWFRKMESERTQKNRISINSLNDRVTVDVRIFLLVEFHRRVLVMIMWLAMWCVGGYPALKLRINSAASFMFGLAKVVLSRKKVSSPVRNKNVKKKKLTKKNDQEYHELIGMAKTFIVKTNNLDDKINNNAKKLALLDKNNSLSLSRKMKEKETIKWDS
uniref:Uncharacterized protein n=1 Tax=Strongyloides stercoralis TaxID=6248 RepID=A0A0K0EBY9_STRER